jgi:hypothetical protein
LIDDESQGVESEAGEGSEAGEAGNDSGTDLDWENSYEEGGRSIIQDDEDDFLSLDDAAQAAVRCLQDYHCPWNTNTDQLFDALSGKGQVKPWAYCWAISAVARALSPSVSFLPTYLPHLSKQKTANHHASNSKTDSGQRPHIPYRQ